MIRLTTEFQEHTVTVNTSTSPKVRYAYSLLFGGANHSRLTSMTYPDGRILRYEYASGIDDSISRLSYLADDLGGSVGTHLEELSYLGLGTIIQRAHPESGVDLTYIGTTPGDGGDPYTGMDRFGNIIDQNWTDGTTDADRYQYGYDRDSNRLFKKNTVNTTQSELYGPYDNLGRLTTFARGTLNGTNDAISGAASREQEWELDALGNWTSITTDSVEENRTHNKQNELTQVGTNPLTYDNNGNLTTDEQGHTLTYDAWNRLVSVSNGATPLASYTYDALGRRINETNQSDTTDLYYSSQWQVIEERKSGTPTAQYVWSPTYVDDLIERDNDTPDGTLDVGFGGDGQVVTSLTGGGIPTNVAVQSDGKIVAAGYVGSTSKDFALVRYNPDGSLDSTFGGGDGIVVTDMGSNSDYCYGLAIQSDGKIVLAGNSGGDFALARYTTNGSLDTTFDSDGKVITDLGGMEYCYRVAIQSDGKIVAAGMSDGGGTRDFAVVRYNADGSLDSGFDSDGIATADFGGSSQSAYGLAIQSNGRIILAGYVQMGGNMNFAMARFNTDGSLDTSFDSDGKRTTDFGSYSDFGRDVKLQSDGKIVVSGNKGFPDNYFVLARYNTDGSLDNTFGGGDGLVITQGGMMSHRYDLAIQPDGKILVGEDNVSGIFKLERYDVDGSLDGTFDGDGVLSIQPEGGSGSGYPVSLAIQSDGKILLAGMAGGFNLARINAGPLDQRLYAAQDANHNVTALIDTSGAVVERYEYDPYGKVSVLDTNWAADADGISDVGSIYLYQDLRFDPVTGLYHTDHREYGPNLGRWNRPDPHPAGPYVQGMNPVQFVGSNPVNRIDPEGLEWKVTRDGKDRAMAEGGCDDIVADLATQIHLTASDFSKWLHVEDQGSLPKSASEKIGRERKFSVPNTAYVDRSSYSWGFFGYWNWGAADTVSDAWKAEGLNVINTNQWQMNRGKALSHLRDPNLYKYFYVGHGDRQAKGALYLSDGNINPDTITAFGIADMRLVACWSNSGANRWVTNVSVNGQLETWAGEMSLFSGTKVVQPGTR